MIISLDDAKNYLHVDGNSEDITIETLLKSAQNLCQNVARIDDEAEFAATGDIAKTAILFTLGCFYDHRGDTDLNIREISLILRSILFGARKAAF